MIAFGKLPIAGVSKLNLKTWNSNRCVETISLQRETIYTLIDPYYSHKHGAVCYFQLIHLGTLVSCVWYFHICMSQSNSKPQNSNSITFFMISPFQFCSRILIWHIVFALNIHFQQAEDYFVKICGINMTSRVTSTFEANIFSFCRRGIITEPAALFNTLKILQKKINK